MTQSVDSLEVARDRLIDIVLRREPRLLVVSAPAGYGKSTFVRQLLARLDDWALCDCLTVRGEFDLARGILAALAAAQPDQADAIARAQLGAINNPSDWEAVATHFWRGAGSGRFVFENAETLTRSPSASALFERLVRAGNRRVIICSRDVVPVPYGHGLDPLNVVIFGIEDLRFSTAELRTAAPDVSPCEIARIETISRGWPIVVALLGRAAREKPFADIEAGLEAVAYDQLLMYLASELLADLSDRESGIALVLAALPDPTHEDIARGWPAIAPADIDRFAAGAALARNRRRHPFAPDGHPVVSRTQRTAHPDHRQAGCRSC